MRRFLAFGGCWISLLITLTCSHTDDRLAQSTSSKRAEVFAFFNAVRLDLATEEGSYSRLEGFTEGTKTFLEDRKAQSLYRIAGMYFEKNLDREQGAYEYADRFYGEGLVVHLIIYPSDEEYIWESLLGKDKGKGKQVGSNFVYYQVFTANPPDPDLEEKITLVIENNINKYAATIGQPLEL